MDQQHKRESHYENQQTGTTDRSRVSRQRLFETAPVTVVALGSLALIGILANTVPAVVVMLGAYAFVMTMPVVVPYVTVRVVTGLLQRRESR
jgi:hypothetical protein